jgi:hypothetical protein
VFEVWLKASPWTPRGYAYADAMRAALARAGAAPARGPGRVVWAAGRRFTVRLPDGSSLAIAGGPGVTQVAFRTLTPGVCDTLFAMGQAAQTVVAAPAEGGRFAAVPAFSPFELCERLAPAFSAWRRSAPPRPLDLRDLDRRPRSAARADTGRKALFY